MFEFGKKLISVIFVSSLLVGNAVAAGPKLSGNYIFSLKLEPPSGAISIPLIFEAKITPNKINTSGRIAVTRSSVDVIDGVTAFQKGSVMTYSISPTEMTMSNVFDCSNYVGITGVSSAAIVGTQPVAHSCNDDIVKSDIYYANIDSNKVAHYAVIHGKIERIVIDGSAIQTGGATITISGTLVRQ